MNDWRLLIDSPADGVTNMGRDEALLVGVGEGASPPTMRFYKWDPPTISLGYFQSYSEYESLAPPVGDLAVVRRTTGGGAILHDREWTYSMALPTSHPLVQAGATQLYDLVHAALIDTLALLGVRAERGLLSDGSSAGRGPFFCFDRRHCTDVLLDGDKLAGSAQRRTKTAILQHGSIILANRYDQHHVAAITNHVDLEDDALLTPFVDALEQRLGVTFEEGEWSADELARADEFAAKYGGEEWTRKYP
ncbi:MAG: lipoate--protein ligase family protein [Planctomycetes bacterium]|nr:lipoate--protein ligase family protein [Planctomycetota bacterium]